MNTSFSRIFAVCVAIALIMPVGAASAPPAGAAGYSASCKSDNAGILSSLSNDPAIHDNGGLLWSRQARQQYILDTAYKNAGSPPRRSHTVSRETCTGGVVTAARIQRAQLTTSIAVNCSTIINRPVIGGYGTITWVLPAHMGVSVTKLHWLWTSFRRVKFSGSVSKVAGTNNAFKGRHVEGYLTTTESLNARPYGGSCRSATPLRVFHLRHIEYSIS